MNISAASETFAVVRLASASAVIERMIPPPRSFPAKFTGCIIGCIYRTALLLSGGAIKTWASSLKISLIGGTAFTKPMTRTSNQWVLGFSRHRVLSQSSALWRRHLKYVIGLICRVKRFPDCIFHTNSQFFVCTWLHYYSIKSVICKLWPKFQCNP